VYVENWSVLVRIPLMVPQSAMTVQKNMMSASRKLAHTAGVPSVTGIEKTTA